LNSKPVTRHDEQITLPAGREWMPRPGEDPV
jgi:hypothetical protein